MSPYAMSIATKGGRSPVSQNFNYILYKCNVERNILNNDSALYYMLNSLNKSFRTSDEALAKDAFIKWVLYEREKPTFF